MKNQSIPVLPAELCPFLPNASGLISQGFEQQVRGMSEQLHAMLQGRA